MKVDIIARKLNLGGGGSNLSLDLIASMLHDRGHTVVVKTLNSQENSMHSDDVDYVVQPVCDQWPATNILKYRLASRVIKDSRADIIHIFNPRLLAGGGLVKSDIPIVGRLNTYKWFCTDPNKISNECYKNCGVVQKFRHDAASTHERWLKFPLYISTTHLESKLLSSLDRLFALSPTVKDIYAHNGLDPDIIDIMPNFYDPKFGHGKPPRTGGVKKLLVVSRLKPWKNVDLAISAIAGTGLELDIVGDGGCRQDLQRLASGIQEDVRFHGWVANNDLSNFYEAADLFIHSARIPEPFGRTILEAMQHNLPVIVPDVGAPAWVAGDAGCIYSTDDIESLRSQIMTLADNNSLYVQRSAACADELQRFAPATTMDRMIQTYRRVINKSHTNR